MFSKSLIFAAKRILMRPGLGEKLVHLRFETQFAEWNPFGLLEHRDLVAAQQAVKGQGGISKGFGQEPEEMIHGVVRGRNQQHAFNCVASRSLPACRVWSNERPGHHARRWSARQPTPRFWRRHWRHGAPGPAMAPADRPAPARRIRGGPPYRLIARKPGEKTPRYPSRAYCRPSIVPAVSRVCTRAVSPWRRSRKPPVGSRSPGGTMVTGTSSRNVVSAGTSMHTGASVPTVPILLVVRDSINVSSEPAASLWSAKLVAKEWRRSDSFMAHGLDRVPAEYK